LKHEEDSNKHFIEETVRQFGQLPELKKTEVKKNTRKWKLIKFWQDQSLVMAAKLGPSESRTKGDLHQ